jgi:nitrogen fixation/metabolism regulation signal transduction histidine kinase
VTPKPGWITLHGYEWSRYGGYWSKTDEKEPAEYLEKFISDSRIVFDATIDKRGERHTAEYLPHVTSHFFTKKSRHIGMGLTFAQRIMDEQDGELSIDSSEDQGTTVTFFLKKERRRPIRTKKL